MKDPADFLECFLVGGAVRDKILGEPAGDRDWVVIGATEKRMENLGFKSVGKDFPVFLHPTTHEEYALARRERKVGTGYRGFKINTSPTVTLEEDLKRRDLTVNALALSVDGKLIDPFGGVADLKAGRLRHVSPAFSEDPVRVLRIARFASRFATKGFKVASETEKLITNMVKNGEVDTLVPERVWRELVRALSEHSPAIFFEILRNTGALACILPEIEVLFGIPQQDPAYPEGNVGTHALMALEEAALLSNNPRIRFAALVHDLEKGVLKGHTLPSNSDHEKPGVLRVNSMCLRLRAPIDYSDLALIVTKNHLLLEKLPELSGNAVLQLLQAVNAFRKPKNVEFFVLACQGISKVKIDAEKTNLATQLLKNYVASVRKLDLTDLENSYPKAKERGREAKRRKLAIIAETHVKWTKLCPN